ncbi:MAG: 1-phosphofructokinase [Spirochaetales bacterium]|nr:1-phosphofructokinase [Spirochaetales bacterium]
MKRILTVTVNPAIDLSTSVEQVLEGGKLRCSAPQREPGGGGINVSRALHKLGGRSRAVYVSGGIYGQLLEKLLENEGIEQEPYRIEGQSRQNVTVRERSSERQYRFVMPGPELSPEHWRGFLEELFERHPETDYLVASGSLPPGFPEDFYARLCRRAVQRNIRVVVDTAGRPLQLAAEAGAYLVKPNLRELEHIAGREIEDEQQQEDLARSIVREKGTEVVLLSLGASGALLVSEEATRRITAPAVPIRSRVGAGDSMVAGLVLALAQGRPLEEAATYAVAAGSAAVMTPGSELCRREDFERIFRRMSGRR